MRHGSASKYDVFKLIDMDAAAKIDVRAGFKISSAFCPPELARLVLWAAADDKRETVVAAPSFDAFSLGAVLFEVSSRTPLIPSDRYDDNLVKDSAKVELSNWLGIDKGRLARFFKADDDASVDATAQQIEDCKHLLFLVTRLLLLSFPSSACRQGRRPPAQASRSQRRDRATWSAS